MKRTTINLRRLMPLLALPLLGVSTAALGAVKKIERVSVSSAGVQGNNHSGRPFPPSITPDGRYVAFESSAGNLVPNDTNNLDDVFVRDRVAGTTERVTVSSSGTQGSGEHGVITADGRLVAFTSSATTLVPGDTNGQADIFVKDRTSGTTERVSVSSSGAQGDQTSQLPAISADGRYVAYQSDATTLVPGDTNGARDVFVRDRVTGTTERVTVSSSGAQGSAFSGGFLSLSADGRFIAFESDANNLASGDTNNTRDVFVRDRVAGTTERISLASDGAQASGPSFSWSISADGRYVAFDSAAANLVPGDTNGQIDAFVRDRQSGTTERVSLSTSGDQGNGASGGPAISADGRFVAFLTVATNLIPGGDANGSEEDVLVRDRSAGTTERFSVSSDGAQADLTAHSVTLSAGGAFVAFRSSATNLVPGDTNGVRDVFVAERAEPAGVHRIAVFRPSTRQWFLRNEDGSATVAQFGGPNDLPAPANYLGDGKTAQVAVFRPGAGPWFLRADTGATLGPTQFGGPDDVPVPANYVGDGKRTQIAVFRPGASQWFIRTDTGGTAGPVQFGGPGDVPVPADYLGIGRAQIAVFRPGPAEWYIRTDQGTTLGPIQFGDPGDIPLPRDYLGIGRAQIAVYRPSAGLWFVRGLGAFTLRLQWGGPGDQPMPAPYAPRFGAP